MDTMPATRDREDNYGETAKSPETLQEKLANDGKQAFIIIYQDRNGRRQMATVFAQNRFDADTKFRTAHDDRMPIRINREEHPDLKIPRWDGYTKFEVHSQEEYDKLQESEI